MALPFKRIKSLAVPSRRLVFLVCLILPLISSCFPGAFNLPSAASPQELEGELSVIMGEGQNPIFYLNTGHSWVELMTSSAPDPSLYGRRIRVAGHYDPKLSTFVASKLTLESNAPAELNPTTGEQSALVIAARFSDIPTTHHDISYFGEMLFGKMNDYYREASFGKIYFKGDVLGWYSLPKPYSYYVDVTSMRIFTNRTEELASDAIRAADPDAYFPNYLRIYLVFNGEFRGRGSLGLETFETDDGRIRVSVAWLTEVGSEDVVGIWAHETGHNLGLPDLYDYDERQAFVGKWDLMSEGCWNDEGLSPAHICSYGKIKLGWITQDQITELHLGLESYVTLDALETDAANACKVVKIPIGGSYYLVEVRQQVGHDLYLPDRGVLILHVDEAIESGHGPIRVVDSTPATVTIDDATFDVRPGKPRDWLNSSLQLTIDIAGASDGSYEVSFSYGDRVIVDLPYVSRPRADIGSEQTIGFHARWEKSGLPADVVIEASDLRLITNATGWAMANATAQEVGLVSYRVSSIRTTSGIDAAFVEQAFPSIIWDRLAINLWVADDRIDVGGQAAISGTVRYEFDNALASGAVWINDVRVEVISGSFAYKPLTVSDVSEVSYVVTAAEGSDFGITNFRAEPLAIEVVYDRVKVALETMTPRVEVGRNATIAYLATYEYDNSPLVGKVILNDSAFTRYDIGKSNYMAIGVEDDKYGLVAFSSNSVQVTFDRMTLEDAVDTLLPGRISVTIALLYESDNLPVDKATVTVNGATIVETGPGTYLATLTTLSPIYQLTIRAERPGFSPRGVDLSGYSFGNLAVEIAAIALVITSLMLITRRKGQAA